MRRIDRSNQFGKDLKREARGQHRSVLDATLPSLLLLLAEDQPLPAKFNDHLLVGNWAGHRDCHIRPDLVLIYKKPDAESLVLVRLGSHSELGF